MVKKILNFSLIVINNENVLSASKKKNWFVITNKSYNTYKRDKVNRLIKNITRQNAKWDYAVKLHSLPFIENG